MRAIRSVQPILYYAKTIPANSFSGERNGCLFLEPRLRDLSPARMTHHFTSIRNAILAIDRLARSGKLRHVIDGLSAESFRNPNWNANLWFNYKKPELEALLAPFQDASELEKRYFYRMLQFAAEESFVARIGSRRCHLAIS